MMFQKFNQFEKIYVFVSGGIDSTYLYELFKKHFPEKTIPVNCYNPFETNRTLNQIRKNDAKFIELKSNSLDFPYKHYIIEAFKRIPNAIDKLIIQKNYDKNIFRCCYYIKHKALQCAKELDLENAVFISGIKAGDGKQRRVFLSQLKKGTYKSIKEPTFFLKHQSTGMLYCYPFRDYFFKELPEITLKRLRKKYPNLSHSGCYFCPVIYMFRLKDSERYKSSLLLAKKLGVTRDLYQERIKRRYGDLFDFL